MNSSALPIYNILNFISVYIIIFSSQSYNYHISLFFQLSNTLKCLKMFAPSAILSFFVMFLIFFMSSSVSSTIQLSQFYCNLLILLVLGITPTLRWRLDFRTTCPGVLLCFALNYRITSSFNTFDSPPYPSPLPSGVWANTWIPFFWAVSTKLCWYRYGCA